MGKGPIQWDSLRTTTSMPDTLMSTSTSQCASPRDEVTLDRLPSSSMPWLPARHSLSSSRSWRRARHHAALLDMDSSYLARADSVTIAPTILRKDRVSVRPHFTHHIQGGDHVLIPTTHVGPGSSSIGPNPPGPVKEPWPSAGGYKYPLLPEGQVIFNSNLNSIIC